MRRLLTYVASAGFLALSLGFLMPNIRAATKDETGGSDPPNCYLNSAGTNKKCDQSGAAFLCVISTYSCTLNCMNSPEGWHYTCKDTQPGC